MKPTNDNGAHSFTEGATFETDENINEFLKEDKTMKPQFKLEEIYLDLSKLSEEQQERVMCITGTTIEWIKYAGYLIYHKGWKTSNKSWLKDQNLTELTYSQFLDMMGESEEKSKVIENSEKELINNDGTLYIGEGLENYYKDQLERTGKFKVVSIEDYNKLQTLLNHKPNLDYQSNPFPGKLG